MRIIYVENVRIPSERAHAYQIVQTCAWLSRFGATVDLVNPDRADDKNVFAYFGIEHQLFTHNVLSVFDPLAWKWFTWKSAAYAIQRWSFVRALKKWASKKEADIWFTRDLAMMDAIYVPGRRIILELHDRPDHQPERWKRHLPHVTGFVVITHGLKDVLIELGVSADRIVVAPDGYDPKDFLISGDRESARHELGLPNDASVVFYAGGFYPWKGVDLIVSAWAEVSDMTHLVLIGGPDGDCKRLEFLVPKQKQDSIHFFSYRPHAEVIRLMAAADIGLLPTSSKEEIGRSFTSPIKQFEYLAAGLPVFASNVPSSHEVLTDRVAVFFQPDGSDIATKLVQMLHDDVWLGSAQEEAKRLVKEYTWEARSQSIMDFMKTIV